MRETDVYFNKGINRRFSIENGQPDRLYTLQNARLQARGSTNEIDAVEGYQSIANDSNSYENVYDSIFYENDLVILWYDSSSGDVKVTFVDVDGNGTNSENVSRTDQGYGQLLLLGDTIFVTPYDKVLTNVDGTWSVDDFVSTTPTFDVSLASNGSLSQNQAYWYKVRYVYYDGHITKTSYPRFITTDNSNLTVSLDNIDVVNDLDGGNVDIEIFRKEGEGDWYLIERITPDSDPYTYEDNGQPNLRVLEEENYVWPISSRTHEIVRDRLIRANNQYRNVLNNVDYEHSLNTTSLSDGDQGVPYNTDVEIFSEVRKDDGTTTTFKYHGNESVGKDDAQLQLRKSGRYQETIPESANIVSAVSSGDTQIDVDSVSYNFIEINAEIYINDGCKEEIAYVDNTDSSNNIIYVTSPLTNDYSTNGKVYDSIDQGFKEVASYARFRPRPPEYNISFNSFEIYNTHVPSIATSEESEDLQDRPLNPHVLLGWRYLEQEYISPSNNSSYIGVRKWNSASSNTDTWEGDVHNIYNFQERILVSNETQSGTSGTTNGDNVTIDIEAAQIDVPVDQVVEFEGGAVIRLTSAITTGDTQLTGNIYYADISTTFAEKVNYVTFDDSLLLNLRTEGNNDDTIGVSYNYYLKYHQHVVDSGDTTRAVTKKGVFELSIYEAIKEAIRQGRLYVRLKAINTDPVLSESFSSISSQRANDDFINYDVKVVGLKDTSTSYDDPFLESGTDELHAPLHSAIYLILETDTPWDDYDNDVNNNNYGDYSGTYDPVPFFEHKFEFELIGLYEEDTGNFTETDEGQYKQRDYEHIVRSLDYTDYESSAGTLVRVYDQNDIECSLVTPQIQGWEKVSQNNFEFFVQNDWNIYKEIITQDDLEDFQQDYFNQLVWSGSYIQNSNVSKVRNFDYTNFKFISANYGRIKKISYINNILLVFCERGVNQINVGEVLTQQSQGEVYVDSSRILTNDYWVLKNLPDVKEKSIVQYENTLFFCDGKDVWQYTDTFKNISQGAIDFDINNELIGSFDAKHKEYLITDGSQTWAYSVELGQWQGPYTFAIETSSPYAGNHYGVVGDQSVEFNSGTDFNGSSFTILIESIANTLDEPSIMKLFRKFKMDFQPEDPSDVITGGDVIFKYGIDYNSMNNITINDGTYLKNGTHHIGVNPDNKNGRQLYWAFESDYPFFKLRFISFLWNSRMRR